MATNKKSAPRYDLNAQNRKRDLAVRLGLTALVVAFAVGLVLYIVMGSEKKGANEAQAVRIAWETVIKKPGTESPRLSSPFMRTSSARTAGISRRPSARR